MRKIIIIVLAGVSILLLAGLLAIRTWMRQSVMEHITIATEMYSGSPENALIAMLLDEKVSMVERTHKAVWTLGQIKSEKAMPILKDMYKDDPKGETCYGKHDSMICQYEIHKAINAIEKFQLFKFPGLKNATLSQESGTE